MVHLCELENSLVASLIAVSDGSAVFGESAYDPVVIWGWMEMALKFIESNKSTSVDLCDIRWPSNSIENFSLFYGLNDTCSSSENSFHTVIVDAELKKPIGMLSVLHNNPKHLSARLGNCVIASRYI